LSSDQMSSQEWYPTLLFLIKLEQWTQALAVCHSITYQSDFFHTWIHIQNVVLFDCSVLTIGLYRCFTIN
jgi:hypothetical protein